MARNLEHRQRTGRVECESAGQWLGCKGAVHVSLYVCAILVSTPAETAVHERGDDEGDDAHAESANDRDEELKIGEKHREGDSEEGEDGADGSLGQRRWR